MTELVNLVSRYGLWAVIVLFVIYKGVPAFIERFWPDWIFTHREQYKLKAEADASGREALARVYERMIILIEANTKAVTNVASSINVFERALDANTQQIARITDAVKVGPTCPLPDCPFMRRKENETG